MPERFDAIVMGAGAAGSAVALALAQRGWRVCILERRLHHAPRVGETLSPLARHSLVELKLWDEFLQAGQAPAHLIRSLWGTAEPRERSSIVSTNGPGWHLDRNAFDAWLLRKACAAGATLHAPIQVSRVEQEGPRGTWRVSCSDADTVGVLSARYLVDATGRLVWLSRRLAAERTTVDRLVAFVHWFENPASEPLTLIEAAEAGWWYSAPLPQGGLVVAHVTDAALAARQGGAARLFNSRLAATTATRARVPRNPSSAGHRATYAAGPAITTWDASRPWLPVGDALLALDPISGEGLCFALRSALDAACVLADGGTGRERYLAGAHLLFKEHLRLRSVYYALERRWSTAPFWRKRANLC